MKLPRLRLKNAAYWVLAILVLVIIYRSTKWGAAFRSWWAVHNHEAMNWIFFGLLIAGVYYFFYYREKEQKDEMMEKCWKYCQTWWESNIGMEGEKLKPQDTIMKEGHFDSKFGTSERMFGYNTVKKGTNQRIVFIVATNPLRMAEVVNSPRIGEQDDPFIWFNQNLPSPIPGYEPPQTYVPSVNRFARPKREWIGEDGKDRRGDVVNEEV